MVSMRFLPALLLLFATAAGQDGACQLTMWVFEDPTICATGQTPPLTPDATGIIYPDNTCHTVDPTAKAELFPGSYVAGCTSNGQVTFYSSGCTSEACTDSNDDGRCDLDFNSISSYYSLVDPNTHDVLDPSTQDEFIPCKRLTGTGDAANNTVSFAIFGDCSIPECQGVTTPPPTSPSTTAAPVSTTAPTVDLTEAPTEAPVSPTVSPTETEVTDSPTADTPPPSPSPSLPPSVEPVPGSTSAPSEAPVPTTSPTLEPTEDETTPAPQTEQPQATPPPSSSVTTDTVNGLSFLLIEMTQELAGEDKEQWQDLTAEHVKEFYKDDSIKDLSVSITIAIQKLTTSPVSRGRRLQTSNVLQIDFQADLEYFGDEVDGTQLIASSFDSQEDRTAYIKSLQDENPYVYANLNKVELYADGTPVGPPVSMESEDGIGMEVVIGAAVGGVVLLGALAAAFLYSKKKRQAKPASSIAAIPIEESPQKSHITTGASLGTPDAHITTISLGTPDDVSTLGDPVLAGMKFVDGDAEDEHTASVNDVDYDYVKQQRARLVSQDSKRSLDSKSYFPSTLGGIESDVMADDSSFEALFQDSGNGPREERILVIAPPGKLGMVLDTPPGEGPLVHAINENSVLKGRVMVGDRLITVDKEDVSTLSAAKVSVLITQKSQQERTFEFIRGKKR